MADELDDLRDAYINELPTRMRALETESLKILKDYENKKTPNFEPLKQLAHKMAGSAGTYGFMVLSIGARDLEDKIEDGSITRAYVEAWLLTMKGEVDLAILEWKDKNGRMVA